MRLRVANAVPLAMLAGAVLSAALSPDFTPAGPGGAMAAAVHTDRDVYLTREGGSVRIKVIVSTAAGEPLASPVTVATPPAPARRRRASTTGRRRAR